MGWMTCNVNHCLYCAFCRYWYDPTNSGICPVAPAQGMWKVDIQARNICTLNNTRPGATHRCEKFQSKI